MFVLLLAACFQDYREGKIRNWLIVAGLCYGLFLQISGNLWIGFLDFAEGVIGIFLATYPLFKVGMIGAGDVKLFAVCAGALGLQKGFVFLCATFLVAAIPALFKMIYHPNFLQRFRYFFNYLGQVVRSKKISVYGLEDSDAQKSRIPLAGPACLSVLLSLGGFF